MKTLVVADDSLAVHHVVRAALEGVPVEIVPVTDGDETLGALEHGPDALLVDLHMPGPGGYEVCRRVRELAPEAPVVLLVGHREPFDRERLKACGVDGVLMKPLKIAELRSRVASLLELEATPEEVGLPAAAGGGSRVRRGFDEAEPQPQPEGEAAAGELSDADVDRVARRMVELMAEGPIRDDVHAILLETVERVVQERLRELEETVQAPQGQQNRAAGAGD